MVFRPPAAAGSESSLLSSAHTIHSLLSVLHRPSEGLRIVMASGNGRLEVYWGKRLWKYVLTLRRTTVIYPQKDPEAGASHAANIFVYPEGE
jgi:hypothetical protein